MEEKNLNIPKMLGTLLGKSNQLIQENLVAPPLERGWFTMIKELAQKIADGDLPLDSMEESAKSIPDCSTFTQGKAEVRGTRISSYLNLPERDHLHKRNSQRIGNQFNSGSSSKTPQKTRGASIKSKKSSPPQVINDSDDCAIVEEVKPVYSTLDATFVKPDSTTPSSLKRKGSPLSLKEKRKSMKKSKKLSNMTLEQEMFRKKLLSSDSREPHFVTRSSRFSMSKKKISALKESHQLSVLGSRCSPKTSVTMKKERQQCKEDAAAENLKKMKDERRKKMEEKKRIRDEKMERTKEKRIKLEQAKAVSSKKVTTKTTKSTRAQEKSIENKTRARDAKTSNNSSLQAKSIEAIAKTSQGNSKENTPESKKPAKTPRKKPNKTPKKLIKPTLPVNPQSQKATSDSRENQAQTPLVETETSKGTRTSSRSRKPTPPNKTLSLKVASGSSEGRMPTRASNTKLQTVTPLKILTHNTTMTVVKKTENNSLLKKTFTPITPPLAKSNTKSKVETASTSSAKSTSPPVAKKSKPEPSTHTSQTGPSVKRPDSYELTPERTSLVSYDMSEILNSDDEEQSDAKKPIPTWAVGLRLRNALIHQYYNPVDTDKLFGRVVEVPDLELMFNTKKKSYCKRTSSAIWNSPHAFK